MTGCNIHGNYWAVWIRGAESGGTFEDNDLRDNAGGVWDVEDGVRERLVRRNNRET